MPYAKKMLLTTNGSFICKKSNIFTIIQIAVSAFFVYTCMYGFRKAFTVGTYENLFFFGVSYKVCLVIAQVLGYICSKFYGINFISSLQPQHRAIYILLCIGFAWAALFLFAIIPPPYNIICMFLNGLPLGLVFGLVFGFLEGRKTTELMGAILTSSFIFASGLAKTIGKTIINTYNITDWWMPFFVGLVFVIPLLVFVFILQKSPNPTSQDIAERNVRLPMSIVERKNFIALFGKAIVPVVIAYTIFTIVRDFCEDFANELWIETGYGNSASIFAKTNTVVSVIVLLIIALFFIFKNNFKALKAAHWLVVIGLLLVTVSTILFNTKTISPLSWIVFANTGLYIAYITFNCIYFERMIATYKIKSNIGFVMYIADAFGYLGTVLVLIIKEFISIETSWVHFFSFLFYIAALIGIFLLMISLRSHIKLHQKLWSKN